jgi:hypothetical protein
MGSTAGPTCSGPGPRERLQLPVPGRLLYLVNNFGELGGIMGQILTFVVADAAGRSATRRRACCDRARSAGPESSR